MCQSYSLFSTLLFIALLTLISALSSVQPREGIDVNILPPVDHLPPKSLYEYHVVPNDEKALAEFYNSNQWTIWDLLPKPLGTIWSLLSAIAKVTAWTYRNKKLILLGLVSLIGALIVKKSFLSSLGNASGMWRKIDDRTPSLDEVESLLNEAHRKYDKLYRKQMKSS